MILAITVIHFTAFPQNGVSLILLKGEANLTTNTNNHKVVLVKALKVALPRKSVVSLSAGARALVFNSEKRVEIGGVDAVSLAYDAVTTQLKNVKTSSATIRFLDYLNKMYSDKRSRDESAGSTLGAASRGVNEWEFTYSPDDSTIMISDTVKLSWDSYHRYTLINKLLVINTRNGDTLYNAAPVVNTLILDNLKEGEYHWSTRIKGQDGIILKMDNLFYVPSVSKCKSIKEDLKIFTESTSSFSVETRALLLDDYMKQNKIYYYKK